MFKSQFFSKELDGWESLGCWRDLPTRAIASLEGKSKLLGDNWKQRANPLNACAEAAKDEKLKVFAVQDGGQCFGGPYAHIFYDQYGPSNLCKGTTLHFPFKMLFNFLTGQNMEMQEFLICKNSLN